MFQLFTTSLHLLNFRFLSLIILLPCTFRLQLGSKMSPYRLLGYDGCQSFAQRALSLCGVYLHLSGHVVTHSTPLAPVDRYALE